MLPGIEKLIESLQHSMPENASEKDIDVMNMVVDSIRQINDAGSEKLNDKKADITVLMDDLKKKLGDKYGTPN